MSDAVWIQLITSLATIAAIVVTALVNKKSTENSRTELAAGQTAIHTLVDGHSTAQIAEIKALKLEIARLNRGGESGTPKAPAGEGAAPVTMDEGVVTAEKTGKRRRHDDV